jgi:hypothetical protein
MARSNLAEAYYDRLPARPWASNDVKAYGLQHYAKPHAVKRAYIQTNPPHLLNHLVFDIDQPTAFGCWDDANLPEPNVWVGNRTNGHGHAIYRLATPVCTSRNARPAPLAFADAITDAFTARLGADQHYTGLIAKNPLSGAWDTVWLHGHSFPLNVLAEYVDLTLPATNSAITIGGRNCTLFDDLRRWAYGQVNGFKNFDAWSSAVLNHAQRLNTFTPPLPYSSVKATAKSVAKWVFNHHGSFVPKINRGRDCNGKTRHDCYEINAKQYRPGDIQRLDHEEVKRRQVKAAAGTNAARTSKVVGKVEAAIIQLRDQAGIELPSLRQIAKLSGVSLDSVYRHYPELKTKLLKAA